ncbi:MAG TPA: hypothetical protein VNT76_00355 [Candidatus Binatus sp.]|nr:hypothetical protein [Candidatus Binatus sp.]
MDDIRRDEQRDQLIAALMTAEDYDYDAAATIVAEFERVIVCPRCGNIFSEGAANKKLHELSGTIWDDLWMSRSD